MDLPEHENEALAVQREIYRNMSPEQKLRIAFAMNRQARQLKAAWLAQLHPDWTASQIEQEVKRIFLYART